jgi:hypothetical protein
MNVFRLVEYIVKDTINARVGREVVAGILTVAAAAAIGIICLAFNSSATAMIEGVIEATKAETGVVHVGSTTGKFHAEAEAELRRRLRVLQAKGKVDAETFVITSLESIDFPFTDHTGKPLAVRPTLWCIPYDAPLVDPKFGFRPLAFGRSGKVGPGLVRKDGPRLGILANVVYLRKYYGWEDDRVKAAMRNPSLLPDKIAIQFNPIPIQDGSSFVNPKLTWLSVSGWFDGGAYPVDLLATLDVAGAYFESATVEAGERLKPKGRLEPWHPLHLRDQETGQFLIPREGIPSPDVRGMGTKQELLQFKPLVDSGWSPYDRAIVPVTGWKLEKAREEIRDALAMPQSIEENQLKVHAVGVAEVLRNARREDLSQILSSSQLSLSPHLVIYRQGSDQRGLEQYTVRDLDSMKEFRFDIHDGHVAAFSLPPWRVTIPAELTTRALLRIRAIIQYYSAAILTIVTILAILAVVLLSFCHVLRKTRDIGMLYSQGAANHTIFTIYLGEVLLIGLIGYCVGIAMAYIVAGVLEPYAALLLQRFLEDVQIPKEGGVAIARVLVITPLITLLAFAGVVACTLCGASYPAFRATRTDPLASLTSGA